MGYILGVSAYYHDSAVVLLKDDEIVAAAQEERFTRVKHDANFPEKALRYVLHEAAITLADIECVAFYDKPFLKFERLLETYHAFAPKGLVSFIASMPIWIKEKLFLRSMLADGFATLRQGPMPKVYFPEHHLSHSASAFYPSPFEESAILTLDGVGEWVTTSLCHGKKNQITVLKEIHFPHSIGLLYSTFTAYCGFKVNSGEYKLMGLAPYGHPGSEQVLEFERKIRQELIDIRDDGSFVLNMHYFSYATHLQMYNTQRWQTLFGLQPRMIESEELDQSYMNMALAIQNVTEDIVLRLAKTARKLTGCPNLCLAGGVALNCVANGKIIKSGIFDNIWIQPASGDAGGALGAAQSVRYIVQGHPRPMATSDNMNGAYLGPSFSEKDIAHTAKRFSAPYTYFDSEKKLVDTVADLIAEGNVIGWFQGRMEYGPRALGNRSILGDPRNPDMQKRLNLKIKYREGFRPFAPSVLEEHIKDFFDLDITSPYMLIVASVAKKLQLPLPDNYYSLPMYERLYCQRSTLPAITHIDYSARVQSINKRTNPRYWSLADAFLNRHGCPVLVNTSFNVRGEPIVCTPEDAYLCFMRTEMDYLVLGNFLFTKQEQSPLKENGDWRKQYVLD